MAENATKLFLAALIAAALSACGGGGGSTTASTPTGTGGSGTTTPPPVGPTAADVALQLAPLPIASTYTGEALAAFNRLNEIRVAGGQGYLKQNAQLDKAAQSQADYLLANNPTIAGGAGHDEVPGKPGFTGADLGARVAAAGFAASPNTFGSAIEAVSAGGAAATCPDWLLGSAPHGTGLLSGAREVGIGIAHDAARNGDICVFVLATSGTAYAQLPATSDAFAVAPAGGIDTDIRFPVLANLRTLDTRTAVASDVLIARADLKDASGNLVDVTVQVSTAGARVVPGLKQSQLDRMPDLGVAMQPTAWLVPGAKYTASVTAVVQGKTLSRTWTFTTLPGSGYGQ